jgi:hypothetical protein
MVQIKHRTGLVCPGSPGLVKDNEREESKTLGWLLLNPGNTISKLARALLKRKAPAPQTSDAHPLRIVARELRRILDGCPICDGGFRNHYYALLATVVMEESKQNEKQPHPFFRSLSERRWRSLLEFQEWNASKDAAAAFAFRCAQGRLGILTVLTPAESASDDSPLDFAILSVDEGRELAGLIAPEKWIPLRSSHRRRS